jgi:uncharacterized protein YcbX
MTLHSIHLYPIKSLDPISVGASRITEGGILEYDRVWAMRNEEGRFIRGKSNDGVHRIRSRFILGGGYVTLTWGWESEEYTFRLGEEDAAIEGWLERRLGGPVQLVTDMKHGFPDDTDASGPTVVSIATLETVASWFRGFSLDEIRRRFRPNLVLDGVPAFWEDRLYTATEGVRFRIGDVMLTGTNPCARCVVPTRDPASGEADTEFMRTFIDRRRSALPSWAAPSRFDHFYRLSVNTVIDPREAGKMLRIGDAVTLL